MFTSRWLIVVAVLAAGCGANPDPATDLTGAQLPDVAAPNAPAAAPVAAADAGAATLASSRFQLGTHYNRLSPAQPTSSSPDQVEVAEVFWYGCPHCNDFERYLSEWQKTKPDYVSFVRIPAVWNPLVRLHARAFYAAEELGKGTEMHEAFFREIHVNGNMLDSEEKLAAFFAKFGVDQTAFKTAFDSFTVHSKLQRADELGRRYEIPSVPSIVVNGKYTTTGSLAGSYEALIDLIDELAAAERTSN